MLAASEGGGVPLPLTSLSLLVVLTVLFSHDQLLPAWGHHALEEAITPPHSLLIQASIPGSPTSQLFNANSFSRMTAGFGQIVRLNDINNSDQFVGVALIDGVEHGIVGQLLPTPEPSSFLLAALGFVALSRSLRIESAARVVSIAYSLYFRASKISIRGVDLMGSKLDDIHDGLNREYSEKGGHVNWTDEFVEPGGADADALVTCLPDLIRWAAQHKKINLQKATVLLGTRPWSIGITKVGGCCRGSEFQNQIAILGSLAGNRSR